LKTFPEVLIKKYQHTWEKMAAPRDARRREPQSYTTPPNYPPGHILPADPFIDELESDDPDPEKIRRLLEDGQNPNAYFWRRINRRFDPQTRNVVLPIYLMILKSAMTIPVKMATVSPLAATIYFSRWGIAGIFELIYQFINEKQTAFKHFLMNQNTSLCLGSNNKYDTD